MTAFPDNTSYIENHSIDCKYDDISVLEFDRSRRSAERKILGKMIPWKNGPLEKIPGKKISEKMMLGKISSDSSEKLRCKYPA